MRVFAEVRPFDLEWKARDRKYVTHRAGDPFERYLRIKNEFISKFERYLPHRHRKDGDEGWMADDIEDCIKVVIKALKKKNTTCPPEVIVDWCVAMSRNDRVGFICDEEIQSLQESVGG